MWVDEVRFEERTLWVSDGRVAALGGRASAIDAGGREDVRVIDVSGKYIIPSFVDAHFHLLALAGKQLRCDLSLARNADEAVALLAAWAQAHPGRDAVVGVDFDESDWDDPALPVRAALDAIAGDRPVYARRICGHVGVANTALLDRLTSRPASSTRGRGGSPRTPCSKPTVSRARRRPHWWAPSTVRIAHCTRSASPPSTTSWTPLPSTCTWRGCGERPATAHRCVRAPAGRGF